MLALLLAPSIASASVFNTLTITNAGTGTGTVKCEINAGPSEACAGSYPNGTSVEVVAFADADSEFIVFSAATGSASGCSGKESNFCSFTLEADSSVTATFDLKPTPTLYVTVKPSGSGTVTSTPAGIECSSEPWLEAGCVAEFQRGTVVALTPHASPGYEFAGWQDGPFKSDCHFYWPCEELTMEGDEGVQATFRPEEPPPASWPSIESEFASGLTSTNAVLNAEIDPNSESGIAYQFQLVTDPEEYYPWPIFTCAPEPSGLLCAPFPIVEGALPIEFFQGETQVRSLDLSSVGVTLQPGTTYHYRVLASPYHFTEDLFEWEEPIVTGADQTFTTPKEGAPTNRRTLKVTKSPTPGSGTGAGSVTSKPAGIKCGPYCSEAVASMYKETPVTLSAKPGKENSFVEWTGACAGKGNPCTIPMAGDEEVGAVFSGPSKVLNPAEPLTLSKGEGTGQGTVKGSGIACEAQCTETVVLYQGPKPPKAATTVTLTATPAFGSTFTGWSGSGCSGTGSCVVTMSAAENVTATFTAKPNGTLSIEKALNSGTVTSKAKGIKCATACISQSASMPQGESIVLTAMAVSGMTFSKWEGGDCEGIALPTCTVVMDSSEPIKAIFTGTPKAVSPEEDLTLTKAGSGLGTVKGSGLTCEALCTGATSIYKGPTSYPAKTVTLEAASAPGSKKVVWNGCESEPEPEPGDVECVVVMDGAQNVTATFDELE